MKLVRVIKAWDYPDIMQQTPGSRGVWQGVQFTLEPIRRCDYAIVLNRVPQDTVVECPASHVWAVMQEPPIREFRWLRKGFHQFAAVYTQDTALRKNKFIHSQPALPWHVGRDYDWLSNCAPPVKSRDLSWITSDATRFRGHRRRMTFLEKLRRSDIKFDLWGRGFTPIAAKWDGLAPYRYSLAIENHRGTHYWTEKLADCFLSWTMPIYYGCSNILDFFPDESMVRIDIEDPDVLNTIRDTIHSDLQIRNREAIAHARQLVLEKYQFFPFICSQIRRFEQSWPEEEAELISLENLPWLMPLPFTKRVWALAIAVRQLTRRGRAARPRGG